MSRTLQGVVFPQAGAIPTEEEVTLKQALLYRDTKVQELMKLQTEQRDGREKLVKLKQESASLMESNRQLQLSIAQKLGPQGAEKPEATVKLEDKLKGLAEKNAVLRRVFMSLVIESGVNWAKDSNLMDLMMLMEHSPSMMWTDGFGNELDPSISQSPMRTPGSRR